MQEVSGSSPLSSTWSEAKFEQIESGYSSKVQQRRPGRPPYVCSDPASSPPALVERLWFPGPDRCWSASELGKSLFRGPVTLAARPPGRFPGRPFLIVAVVAFACGQPRCSSEQSGPPPAVDYRRRRCVSGRREHADSTRNGQRLEASGARASFCADPSWRGPAPRRNLAQPGGALVRRPVRIRRTAARWLRQAAPVPGPADSRRGPGSHQLGPRGRGAGCRRPPTQNQRGTRGS
jgi:hypothetical protein